MSNSTSLHLPLLNKFTVRRGGCASWTLAPIAVIICCAHWAWENERCTSPPCSPVRPQIPYLNCSEEHKHNRNQYWYQCVWCSVMCDVWCVMQCANLWGALQHPNQWLLFMNSLWSPLIGQILSILTFLLAQSDNPLTVFVWIKVPGWLSPGQAGGGAGCCGKQLELWGNSLSYINVIWRKRGQRFEEGNDN